MSGEANGLILIPVGIMAMPYILGGLAVAGIASIGIKATAAAIEYERKRRKKRKETSYGIHRTMNEQTALNVKTSEQIMKELETQRETMRKAAEKNDAQNYSDYVNSLKETRRKSMKKISDAQVKFNTNYRKTISQTMAEISREISERYEKSMKELSNLQHNTEAAKSQAEIYINEARSLLASLTNDYEGQKFSPRQLISLNQQFEETLKLFNAGRYETSIAAAKDLSVGILEEIFEADALKQEWENYLKLCVVLSEEVKTYLESHSVITEEARSYAEQASGLKLEDEIVGINIADYTDRDVYESLTQKADEIYKIFHSEKSEALTTDELKTYADSLNNEFYPQAAKCINKAILNMNNAFSRQNLSEELIDFFEEHNFTFNGYAYDDDQHDKALHIGLENHTTGEELIITLAPELLSDGDIQTHVDLKQIKGDETNEQRKAYYRECVEDVVKGNIPQAKVNIQCNSATRNKLSSDTQTKRKLRK